jgi:hypothetical protein
MRVLAGIDIGQDRVRGGLEEAVRTFGPLLDELLGGQVPDNPLGTIREVQRWWRHVMHCQRRLVTGHGPCELHERSTSADVTSSGSLCRLTNQAATLALTVPISPTPTIMTAVAMIRPGGVTGV